MLNIIENKNIEYSINDTFVMNVTNGDDTPFPEEANLRFIITKSEQSNLLVDNMYDLNSDYGFSVTLTEADKKKLPLGLYMYKIVVYSGNSIITRQSGYFNVIWGE